MAISKEIFDALVTLLGDGSVEVPDIEQIRAITKVNKASKEERERNREIAVLTAKIRGRAAIGEFDLGEHVVIMGEEVLDALTAAGYVVVKKRDEEDKYWVSWDENVIPSTPLDPIKPSVIPSIPLRPADKIPSEGEEGNGEDTETGDNEEGSL